MNKKVYIMLSLSIFGINGSTQYIYNKCSALEAMGWEVILFTGNTGKTVKQLSKIYIEPLKKYENNIVSELQFAPELFSKCAQNNVLERIKNRIPFDISECIIESSSIETALWGEKLSQVIGRTHFWFDLQENHSYTDEEKDFVEFKMKQHMLAGISKESVLDMLGVDSLSEEYMVSFKAYCSNSVQNIDYPIPENVLNSDIRIGFLGRLNKPYVIPALIEIKEYLKNNQDKKFALVMIGGAPESDIVAIKKILNDSDNLYVHITDYIYPIPRNMVKLMDVFISSSGSAVVSMRENIPTIVYDANKLKPIGILDYTLKNDLYSEGNYYLLDKLLNDILKHDYCRIHSSFGLKEAFDEFNYEDEVHKQISYIKSQIKPNCYEKSIAVKGKKECIQRIIGKLFGVKALLLLRRMKYWK